MRYLPTHLPELEVRICAARLRTIIGGKGKRRRNARAEAAKRVGGTFRVAQRILEVGSC